ncbi:MAG: glycoside hydrolase family 13 protein [Actinomycetota bacterium]|nr:glycoside hydrolase family 13 protein [Actinomycetota bacterium]
MSQSASGLPWWASAVFYQVYPRSFADGTGDGTGDLIGLRERLDYLVQLGVDAVWISPFYRSPMADGGYDVSDPCDVDPLFGTLEDFDRVLTDAHARGLRVTVDVVPNHVSNQHPWFRAALAAPPGSPERTRFIFRPGRGESGALPPNNWPSQFGGPAWTRVPDGEWYLHIFAAEQPDLDWTNPEVPAEFERVFRFWLDRGVDGFRIDVGQGLAKPPGLPDMDLSRIMAINEGALPSAHDLRWDRDGVHAYHRGFRRVLDSYPGERMALGEVWASDDERLARYVRPDELNLTFNFELSVAEWDAESLRKAIDSSLSAMSAVGAPCTWVIGNHDMDRPATRYGGADTGTRRARAAALVELSLPGAVCIYNGDELGLANVELPDDALRDPTWERSGHTVRGRDGERVPLPWSGSAPPYGFTTGSSTWLPMPAGWAASTVQAQDADPDSTLNLYREALRLRRLIPEFATAPLEWADAGPDVVSYRRASVSVVVNAGSTAVPLPAGEVLLSSGPTDGSALAADTAAWVRT